MSKRLREVKPALKSPSKATSKARAKKDEKTSDSSLIPHPSSLVAVIMGSTSDWETMRHASDVLKRFDVPHECRVVSAHRTPAWMSEFAAGAETRGLEVIIAGAGGAAHLPGMVAAQTLVPVLGVPVESRTLRGMDSLLSIGDRKSTR